jgi:hypothetical protein
MGKVSIVGAGMRSHPGVAAKVFNVLGESRINIEMISTSPIKISCVIPGRPRAGRRAPAARGLRARGRGHDPRRGPVRRPAMTADPRVAVVGATGAVGAVMLSVLAERDFPVTRDRRRSHPSARPGERSTASARCSRSATTRSPASTSRCSPPAAAYLARVGSPLRRRRGDRHRQLERVADGPAGPARRQRGQPARARLDRPRHRRQPELHDDDDHAAAEGAARRLRSHRARRDELSGSRWRRAEGHRRAGCAGSRLHESRELLVTDGAAAIAEIEYSVHAAPLAYNVVPWLGAQADDGYSDEEMKLVNESRKILELPRLASARPASAFP